MKVNETFFDGRRFLSLFKKEWMENWKKNLMRIVVLFVLFLVWDLFMGYDQYKYGNRYDDYDAIWPPMFFMLMFTFYIGACLSASYMTEGMINKTGKLSVMMLPATPFEKFITRWLIFTVGFLVVLPATFVLADWIRFTVYSSLYPEINQMALFPLDDILAHGSWTDEDLNFFPLILTSSWALQSFFVLGSTLWQKNSFLKTAVAIFCIVIVMLLIGYWSTELFIPSRFYIDVPDKYEHVSEETQMDIVAVFFSVIALFNTVLAYFRYKEMEIINRW